MSTLSNAASCVLAVGGREYRAADMEIVTWVLGGSLVHQDSTGHSGVIYPGLPNECQTIELPDAPFVHLFVPSGAVDLQGSGPLGAGDAVRFTAVGGQKLTATGPAQIPVWEMHATIG